MLRLITCIASLLIVASNPTPALAQLNVFSCEPEWAALVTELAGDRVAVYSATTAQQDPHHIEARPSLIARARNADLLICSGADLEAGWLPLLLRQSGNKRIQPGQAGHFEAASFVERLGVPQTLDRAQGDLHAAGNPHVHLDPRRIEQIAKQLHTRLQQLDPAGQAYYQQRHDNFRQRWQQAMQRWQQQAKPLQGAKVVVHHKDWVYLFDWLNINIIGALEPKPGLPTTAGHLTSLKQQLEKSPAHMIVHAAYQDNRAAKRLAELTNIPVVELPYTVGGNDKASDLFGLFDDTLQRMLRAGK